MAKITGYRIKDGKVVKTARKTSVSQNRAQRKSKRQRAVSRAKAEMIK